MRRDRFGRFTRKNKRVTKPRRDKLGRFLSKKSKKKSKKKTGRARKRARNRPRPVLPDKIKPSVDPPPPGFALHEHGRDRHTKEPRYWLDATEDAPPPRGLRRIPHLPNRLKTIPRYSEPRLVGGLVALARRATTQAKKLKRVFTHWRVGFWFVQPATDGKTYLANSYEVRTGPLFRYADLPGQAEAHVSRFFGAYELPSRAVAPLLIAYLVQGVQRKKSEAELFVERFDQLRLKGTFS